MNMQGRSIGAAHVPELDRRILPPRMDLREATLDCGLRVIALRRSSTPLVEVRIALPAARSGAADPVLLRSLASALYAGAGPGSVNTRVWDLGGELEVSQRPWHLQISGRVPGTGLEAFLGHLAGPLVAPDLEEVGVPAGASSTVTAQDSPWEQLHRELDARRIRSAADRDAAPQGLAGRSIRSVHEDLVRPEGAVLVLVGDLDPSQALASAALAFGEWRPGAPVVSDPLARSAPAPGLTVLDRPGVPQTHFALALPGLNRDEDSYPALQLAELVFGGSLSGRLQRSLRGENGYVYSVNSRFEFAPADAVRLISSSTRHGTAVRAVSTALSEIRRMGTEPPDEAEIRSARDYAVGMASVAGATQATQAEGLLQQARSGLPARWLEHHLRRLMQVDTEEVRAAAESFFSETQVAGALVADTGHIDTAAFHETASAAGLPFVVRRADTPPPESCSPAADSPAPHRKVPER